jgi:hypothetical protein
VSDASSVYQRARADVAVMLGYDLDKLSAEQATRLDVATALRVLLDNQSARLVRGESLDARELLMASEALSRLLPPLRDPPPASNAPDPRAVMWESYKAMRDRGAQFGIGYDGLKLENERLKARVAELEAAGVPAPDAGDCFTGGKNPPVDGSNVVPLREPPSPPAAPPKPAPPAPPGGLLTDSEPEPWRPFVGGSGYDRWSNRN